MEPKEPEDDDPVEKEVNITVALRYNFKSYKMMK